jgi:hypothetical protein
MRRPTRSRSDDEIRRATDDRERDLRDLEATLAKEDVDETIARWVKAARGAAGHRLGLETIAAALPQELSVP